MLALPEAKLVPEADTVVLEDAEFVGVREIPLPVEAPPELEELVLTDEEPGKPELATPELTLLLETDIDPVICELGPDTVALAEDNTVPLTEDPRPVADVPKLTPEERLIPDRLEGIFEVVPPVLVPVFGMKLVTNPEEPVMLLYMLGCDIGLKDPLFEKGRPVADGFEALE